jgi:hypothetical protein
MTAAPMTVFMICPARKEKATNRIALTQAIARGLTKAKKVHFGARFLLFVGWKRTFQQLLNVPTARLMTHNRIRHPISEDYQVPFKLPANWRS